MLKSKQNSSTSLLPSTHRSIPHSQTMSNHDNSVPLPSTPNHDSPVPLMSLKVVKHVKELIWSVGSTLGNLLANTTPEVNSKPTEYLLPLIERLLDVCVLFEFDPNIIVKEKMKYNCQKYPIKQCKQYPLQQLTDESHARSAEIFQVDDSILENSRRQKRQ